MSEETGYQEAQAVGGFLKRNWHWLSIAIIGTLGFVAGIVFACGLL